MRTILSIMAGFVLMSDMYVATAADNYPEEMTTLIDAYTVGRLSTANLRRVCKWGLASPISDEQLKQFRLQNAAFCEGFLSATAEFSQLASDDASPTPGCKSIPSSELLKRFVGGAGAKQNAGTPASEFLLSTVLACGKR